MRLLSYFVLIVTLRVVLSMLTRLQEISLQPHPIMGRRLMHRHTTLYQSGRIHWMLYGFGAIVEVNRVLGLLSRAKTNDYVRFVILR